METFGYLVLWVAALMAAPIVGLASHWAHANLQFMPEKPVDGFRLRDHALNEFLNEDYSWWGHYDEGGWWEFASLRNYLSHALPLVFFVIAAGIYWWDDRAAVMAKVCGSAATIGMQPLFCM